MLCHKTTILLLPWEPCTAHLSMSSENGIMQELQRKPFLHTGKKTWPLCKSVFWEFSTIYWNEEQSYSKKFTPVEDFHTGTINFTLTASLPLWINLQFLKTSWKGVIFCHLKLWNAWKVKQNKIKHSNSRKLCWLSRYITTDLTMHLNVDMMDQTSNKMKYLSLYNIQHTIKLNTGTDVLFS